MAQNGNIFTAFWMSTATAPGTPLTGLSATIKIKESPGGVIVVNDVAMTNVGDGWYEYIFAGYNPAKDYTYTCNPGVTAYIDSGVTDNLQQLISEVRVGFVGRGGDYEFNAQDRKNIKDTLDKVGILDTEIKQGLNETNSHIDIAKGEINDKIKSIEQTEIDTTEIVRGIGVIKAQNTKLAKHIKGEEDKEMTEMEKKHKKMIDDMEKSYAEMEKENEKVVSEKNKEKESIMKDADEIIESLEGEIKTAGENAIAEIKTLLK